MEERNIACLSFFCTTAVYMIDAVLIGVLSHDTLKAHSCLVD